ncbi:5-oxoprolinase subunit B family protein [Rhizohabitans arisaemae]|uniref:5-oxoprolinase subunit B family protein n=1 Tax=Rhizohabitans arisaemae TaxID=2720610 RepID=UPI0024B0D091|nr:allophanate hydrolase subunit 1 [Rhizohabitans arisaemae]
MRLLRCGDAGLLVELGGLAEVHALYGEITRNPPHGVSDVVPAMRTILLRVEPDASLDAVARAVRALEAAHPEPAQGDLVEIPVVYDGADLVEVGELTGLGARGVVEAHGATEWRVAFCGFAPGFGYLVGGDPRLQVPRRPESRVSVPAGAVALAGEFTGVYPRASPGGWQLIGHTEQVVWDPARNPPALLLPGVRVRFTEVA